jgi:predicted DNA-binding WGR domain protein
MYTHYGRIGSAGQTTVKNYPDEAAARAAADKLVREKTGKGYVEKT